MSNELTLFLQDINLGTSMLLSRNSSLTICPALSDVFPKLRNHYCICFNKCQVSIKCHSSISITILGRAKGKKNLSSFFDKRYTFKCSAEELN